MRILIGDLFSSEAKILVNTVNCVGVMGKGIALEFKKRYPAMFEEYQALCAAGTLKPGRPYLYQDLAGNSILNFPTKNDWRSPAKLSYIIDGLTWFAANYESLKIESIAFPPLGCGNGGLPWEIVGPVMVRFLHPLPIEIEVYAPFGTPIEQLSIDRLLSQSHSETGNVTGKHLGTIRPSWFLILEAVRELNAGPYTLHVGRVIFQKICYVLTRCGVQTGFRFSKGSYGPYSSDIRNAVTLLSNANLLSEQPEANYDLLETKVSPAFQFDPALFSSSDQRALDRTVDLFSRVKNTEQAEMIATVLYSYDQLAAKGSSVSDRDIFLYVLDWKKRWVGTKEYEVKNTIYDLAMLGWIAPRAEMLEDENEG